MNREAMSESYAVGAPSGRPYLETRAVKRASPNDFKLVLTGFRLNGSGQKSLDLNGPKKLRT